MCEQRVYAPIDTFAVYLTVPGLRIELWTCTNIHEAREVRDKMKALVMPGTQVVISRRTTTIEDIE